MGDIAGAPFYRGDRLSMVGSALLCVLIVLMIVPEGFNYALLESGRMPDAGSAVSRILWAGLMLGAALVSLARAQLFRLTVSRTNGFLLAFAALAIVSMAWSIAPMVTLRRDFRFVTILLVCIAFCLTGWHERRVQSVVRPLLTLVLAGSVLFAIVAPQFGIHQEQSPELLNAWRGLTNHKNSLGALAGVTLLFWLQGWSAREVRAWKAIPCCLLAISCVWLSRSATSFIATFFAALCLLLLTRWPRSMQSYLKYAVAIVAISLAVYALAMLRLIPGQSVLLQPLTDLTGFDMTFTGRSEIWILLTEQIKQHPLLGVGYGAYWTGPTIDSPSYEFVTRMNGFYPGTAHNGYLEVANDLGWVGLIVLLGYLVQHVRQTLRLFVVDKPQAALYLTLFMQQAVSNLSESHWLSVLSVHFVLMSLVTVALARETLAVQLRLSAALREQANSLSQPGSVVDWRLAGRRA